MATLYPSLEDLKVDQAMQVNCQAISLGRVFCFWNARRVQRIYSYFPNRLQGGTFW